MNKKILIPFFICLVLLGTGIVKTIAQEKTEETEAKLTDEDIAGFQKQAISTIKDLVGNINVIVDKKQPLITRNKIIDATVKLFVSEKSTVQVSSKTGRLDSIPIRTYLNKLKALPYKSITITLLEVYLSKKFILGKDGRYYGTATIFQKFEGKSFNEIGHYTDVTKKSIALVIEKEKYEDGLKDKERWVLKLGDINVEETK